MALVKLIVDASDNITVDLLETGYKYGNNTQSMSDILNAWNTNNYKYT